MVFNCTFSEKFQNPSDERDSLHSERMCRVFKVCNNGVTRCFRNYHKKDDGTDECYDDREVSRKVKEINTDNIYS